MSNKSKVIAIDGPSGSGKSTIAKILADKLGLNYLDTGAMFRSLGYYFDQLNISSDDETKIKSELEKIKFEYNKAADELVIINDENLTLKIREHFVSGLASQFSQVPAVRDYLKTLQREIAQSRPSVLEGRDIGSVIFPDAALKIYLTADSAVRAQRRLYQLKEQRPELEIKLDQVEADIIARDKSDQNRAIAPLVKTDDAIEIDTSHLTIDEIVERIKSLYQERRSLFND